MYYEKFKADFSIFNKIPEINIGEVILRGLIPNSEIEAEAYFINSNSVAVKIYLPNAYVETKQAAFGKMHDFIRMFLLKKGILFSIALKENNISIGYVLCNSPLQTFTSSDQEIDEWTINFWLLEKARGNGIMKRAIIAVLEYLHSMNVPQVFAFVENSNESSITVLKKCNMSFIDDFSIKNMLTFGIKL